VHVAKCKCMPLSLVLDQMVEDLCIHKFSATLYDKLYAECKVHIHAKVDALAEQVC
jgi:hypothetical protein